MMRVLMAALLASGLLTGAVMASVEDQIRSRVEPVGQVCVDGEDCGDIVTSAAPAAAESSGPRSGDEVYGAVCASCHDAGVAGAPVKGNQDQWGARIDKGLDTLVSHAINGFNAMPAKGGCGSCSDEEIEKAVQVMVDAVQ
ncbi:c-type cytochrome [Tamilnaduibacter salinus]|nr:c-type cytochrome [Tamilnaduibacter salinus]PAV24796.1 cytochrome c5 family protein [Tamilnaduibacter salinus]